MKLKTATLIALIGTIASSLFFRTWNFRWLLSLPLIVFFFVLYRKQTND